MTPSERSRLNIAYWASAIAIGLSAASLVILILMGKGVW